MAHIPHHLTILGTDGRTYTNASVMKADWNAGKDFVPTSGGPRVNKEDADRYDIGIVGRYGPYLTRLVTLRKRGAK